LYVSNRRRGLVNSRRRGLVGRSWLVVERRRRGRSVVVKQGRRLEVHRRLIRQRSLSPRRRLSIKWLLCSLDD
jgi:hypothetical protein